ncbi:MAG: Zn-dependent hydrolase [Lachnospiraceae bacterium]
MANIVRMQWDIEQLKSISEPCDAGITRIGFTQTYRMGADFFKRRMMEAGLSVREDNAGNIYGKLEGSEAGLPVILSGSHLDTVRCAGAFDGIAGAVCALEAARMLRENGVSLRHPFEVIGTIEEEGTRFGQVLLGSQFITGVFGDKELDTISDSDGITLREILQDYLPADACPAYRENSEILAVLELHDEQGPVLEAENIDIGIVENIVAISWLTVTVTGFAGHAGTVPMPLRQDAATGACRLIDSIARHTAANYAHSATATIGKLELLPGSSNCIPSKCVFTVDLRSGNISNIDELTSFIQKSSEEVAKECNLEIQIHIDSRKNRIEMDGKLRGLLRKSCEQSGYSCRDINSGAGHDAMIFSARWPTAMLFVPCVKGITHNPAEHVSPEALARGTDVLYQTILALDAESAET